MRPKALELYHSFLEVAVHEAGRMRPWAYSAPFIISQKKNQEMQRIQQLMYKQVYHFGSNFDSYRHLMPVSEKVGEILTLCKQIPYRPGTYRTDFLLTPENEIKIIEITCRFALNGFFLTGFADQLAEQFLEDKSHLKKIYQYEAFYDHLMDYYGDFSHVCILKGEDNRNETKYYIPIFEKAGYPVHVIPTSEIPQNMHLLEGAAVVGELSHAEWCSLPLEIVDRLIKSNMMNDLRTVFLIHDKRFFSVLGNEGFQNDVLTPDEIAEFSQYLVPTYSHGEKPELWDQAQTHKNEWIIKHRSLGKSQKVFAGPVTEESEWQQIFNSDGIQEMILQPYLAQRKVQGTIGDQQFNDFVAGTLLFFGNHFFGPGLFRASSFAVTNRIDDRKIAPLVVEDVAGLNGSWPIL